MAGLLDRKITLITGAGSGIGRAAALAFARKGAAVVVADIDAEGGEETCRQLKAGGGNAHFVRADVSQPAQAAAIVGEVVKVFGSPAMQPRSSPATPCRSTAASSPSERRGGGRCRSGSTGSV